MLTATAAANCREKDREEHEGLSCDVRRPAAVGVRPCKAVEVEEAAAVEDEPVAVDELTVEDGTMSCEKLGDVADDGGAMGDVEEGGVSGPGGHEAADADDELHGREEDTADKRAERERRRKKRRVGWRRRRAGGLPARQRRDVLEARVHQHVAAAFVREDWRSSTAAAAAGRWEERR